MHAACGEVVNRRRCLQERTGRDNQVPTAVRAVTGPEVRLGASGAVYLYSVVTSDLGHCQASVRPTTDARVSVELV